MFYLYWATSLFSFFPLRYTVDSVIVCRATTNKRKTVRNENVCTVIIICSLYSMALFSTRLEKKNNISKSSTIVFSQDIVIVLSPQTTVTRPIRFSLHRKSSRQSRVLFLLLFKIFFRGHMIHMFYWVVKVI